MNFTTFERLQHPTLPTVAKVNEIVRDFYPDAKPIVGQDPKIDDAFERVSEDQLEGAAYDVSTPATDEARKALTQYERKALWSYVTGRGEVGKFEKMLNALAKASGDRATGWWADRIDDTSAIVSKLVTKAKAVTMNDVLDLIAKLEAGDPIAPPPPATPDQEML